MTMERRRKWGIRKEREGGMVKMVNRIGDEEKGEEERGIREAGKMTEMVNLWQGAMGKRVGRRRRRIKEVGQMIERVN